MARTLCETRRDALEATVLVRLDGNRIMCEGMRMSRTGYTVHASREGKLLHDEGKALHTYGERLARLWRS